MPTVEAFKPDKRPYTGPGSVVPILPMPSDSKYMPTAPGRLGWAHGGTGQQEACVLASCVYKDGTCLQVKKPQMAGIKPAWSRMRQNSILVLAGPGSDWHTANIS